MVLRENRGLGQGRKMRTYRGRVIQCRKKKVESSGRQVLQKSVRLERTAENITASNILSEERERETVDGSGGIKKRKMKGTRKRTREDGQDQGEGRPRLLCRRRGGRGEGSFSSAAGRLSGRKNPVSLSSSLSLSLSLSLSISLPLCLSLSLFLSLSLSLFLSFSFSLTLSVTVCLLVCVWAWSTFF